VLGVLPYLAGLALDAEDGFDDEDSRRPHRSDARLRIAVAVYPRISNHTDFDALRLHPQVALEFVGPGAHFPSCDLIVLPGSKSVAGDLAFLRAQGWEAEIRRHLRYGGKLIGICGGMQMLGRALHDPHGVEGSPGSVRGLGLLELETTLEPVKQLRNVQGTVLPGAMGSAPVTGYEIHMGRSHGPALARPAALLDGRLDGAISDDGQILATYLHGLFDHSEACAALLGWAGLAGALGVDRAAQREAGLERLADCVEEALALDRLEPYL
jgi:adenosylcobyric acid synthase